MKRSVLLALLLACGGTDDPATDPGSGADVPASIDVTLEPDAPPDAPAELAPDTPPVPPPEFLGGDRPAAVMAPLDWTPARTWPLVIVLHGFSANGMLQAYYLGLPDHVTDRGAILLIPEGTINSENYQFWNAYPACCDWENSGVDDVGYLSTLIDEAVATLAVDPKRVFLIGHSNGGFMSFRLACEVPGKVAGLAAIAGSMSPTPECAPDSPVSILTIHGTLDDSVPYEGRPLALRPTLSAQEILAKWAALDECAEGPVDGGAIDYDADVAGDETTRTSWTGCAQGRRVEHWKMDGTNHVPGFNAAFQDDVVDWLLAQVRTD